MFVWGVIKCCRGCYHWDVGVFPMIVGGQYQTVLSGIISDCGGHYQRL